MNAEFYEMGLNCIVLWLPSRQSLIISREHVCEKCMRLSRVISFLSQSHQDPFLYMLSPQCDCADNIIFERIK